MESNTFTIGILYQSSKEDKLSDQISNWIIDDVARSKETKYLSMNVNDYPLSLMDLKNYVSNKEKIIFDMKALDAFIIIVEEYNHLMLASLKNALLLSKASLYKKVVGIVSYGSSDQKKAVEYLKAIMSELKMTNVRTEVYLSRFKDFSNGQVFNPENDQIINLKKLISEVNAWGKAALAFR